MITDGRTYEAGKNRAAPEENNNLTTEPGSGTPDTSTSNDEFKIDARDTKWDLHKNEQEEEQTKQLETLIGAANQNIRKLPVSL